ncbi:ATP-dependent Clp protease proteolytic subunit 6, chloroplastic isoform X2 [Amborella trichopoda]|uniref:ATP-dependent Clp protease proteolytic subunit 6, chloroplastic isoform X2 n=1 Tax=Amborella trichopoda TaxID=13333 RepID=UPI0009BD3141|nr:ATP-dependent Clp protease proteolytic subunit 6, chloroplastic isoform X2 [Amborella trichopoda]|eukprot:XP_020530168.1 ATP-dependent Clp protease proteolytic subunit 6, chloroplastic isoform X2 [Amborella trichopoda]
MAVSTSCGLSICFPNSVSKLSSQNKRLSNSVIFCSLPDSQRLFGSRNGLSLKHNNHVHQYGELSYEAVTTAKRGNPPVMPAIMTPGGPLDLSSVLFRNRIIFIGQPINSQVAQRVISQLVTLAAVDEDADIYLNCPGGSTYSVMAIYDCMSWIKPKVGTICFGVAASQGALLLAGGEKGMRYAMPNARIMIHQPQSGCGGNVEDVKRQVNEAVQSRHKIDQMYAAFCGQPLEKVQHYTERDRFFSAAEVLPIESLHKAFQVLHYSALHIQMRNRELCECRFSKHDSISP